MAEYRLYCLDARGRIARRHDIEAEDHAAAIAAGRELAPNTECELWSGSVKIATIPANGDPIFSRPSA